MKREKRGIMITAITNDGLSFSDSRLQKLLMMIESEGFEIINVRRTLEIKDHLKANAIRRAYQRYLEIVGPRLEGRK